MANRNGSIAIRRLAGYVIAFVLFGSVLVRAEDVDRADYKISVPAGSTIDKPDGDIDADHMTTVNLPNGNGLIFIVVDDTKLMPGVLAKLTDEYKGKLKNAVVGTTDAFDNAKADKSALVTGKLNGISFSFAMGEFDRKQKAVVVIFTYPQSEKAETIDMVRKALTTLKIKT